MSENIWIFWMGGDLTKNRIRSIESIKNNSGCRVILVTEENLSKFEKDNSPIHPAFKYLSSVHKSAILRSYFMYHYGGGYSDIKNCNFSWNIYFEQLSNSNYDFIGYYEKSENAILGSDDVKSYWAKLIGNAMFIFKKNTVFAEEWLKRTNFFLDNKFNILKKHPGWYHPRAITGGVQNMSDQEFRILKHKYKTYQYPIKWGEPMGQIFHQLQFENKNSYTGGMPFVDMSNYL